jgi:hypothetical protein
MIDRDVIQQATAECTRRELESIGKLMNVWLLRNESLRGFSHRIAIELQCSIIEREDLLNMVLSLQRHPTCNPKE